MAQSENKLFELLVEENIDTRKLYDKIHKRLQKNICREIFFRKNPLNFKKVFPCISSPLTSWIGRVS